MPDGIIKRAGKKATTMLLAIVNRQPAIQGDPDPTVVGADKPKKAPDINPNLTSQFPAFANMLALMQVPGKRIKELEYYDYLETQIADVRKALDAYATLATTGAMVGGKSGAFSVVRDPDVIFPDELIERIDKVEKIMRVHAHTSIRTMCKYGSYMPQPLLASDGNGGLRIGAIKHIPPGTIFRNVVEGKVDREKYWVQVINNKVVGTDDQFDGSAPKSGFPRWMLLHFALWSNVVDATKTKLYGTSILQPFGAIGLKMEASIDALVVARLTRAAMRYKWKIDCSDIRLNQSAIKQRMAQWKQMLQRRGSLLNDGDNIDTLQRGAVPDADMFIPSGEKLHYDVETLMGDTNLPNINDLQFLSNYYFGALGVPAEYLGHQQSKGGRSSLTQIDIHFARTVRHIQLFAIPPMEQLIWMDMILGGYSPMDYPIKVVPPPIGARDELVQAQIRALQAQVLAALAAAGMDLSVNPRWVLEIFMNMDDEITKLDDGQLEELFKLLPAPSAGGGDHQPEGKQKRAIKEALMKTTPELWDALKNNIQLIQLNNLTDQTTFGHGDEPTTEELQAELGAVAS